MRCQRQCRAALARPRCQRRASSSAQEKVRCRHPLRCVCKRVRGGSLLTLPIVRRPGHDNASASGGTSAVETGEESARPQLELDLWLACGPRAIAHWLCATLSAPMSAFKASSHEKRCLFLQWRLATRKTRGWTFPLRQRPRRSAVCQWIDGQTSATMRLLRAPHPR